MAAVAGIVLVAGGGIMLGVAAAAQQHAPQPGAAQAGSTGPAATASAGPAATASAVPAAPAAAASAAPPAVVPARRRAAGKASGGRRGPALARSLPVSISIPDIGVRSPLLHTGLNRDGTIKVPPLNDPPVTNEAAWYKYSPAPGQAGAAVILGHVDSAADGPSVFFRLGALHPGNEVDITLADHRVAVFRVTGVRVYRKDRFPATTVYGPTGYPALRLITCGGSFDEQTGSYLSNVVAFASLAYSRPA
ncbi:MAG: class F sortase [Nocardiopsaceae bacterium]|nr:class F sortase [Nocardiopsaceae bacterium]